MGTRAWTTKEAEAQRMRVIEGLGLCFGSVCGHYAVQGSLEGQQVIVERRSGFQFTLRSAAVKAGCPERMSVRHEVLHAILSLRGSQLSL